MPLESCMIVIDNSEYTRNGDYTPTRFQAQAQAVASVFTVKTDSNPESSVGLLAMAGKSPSLLVTPTNDIGKLLSALNRAQIGGSADLTTAVQIAQLALKHRENKNARQRVVVFAGSHISESEEDLVKLGKKLRKNNVLIDVCLFGEEGMEGEEKIGKLIEAAGGGDCHLVVIPPGPHLLSDLIQTSPILYDGQPIQTGDGEGGEGGGGDMMAIDPNMDPELAMAIRMSLQDAADQAAREAAAANPPAATSSSSSVPAATVSASAAETSTSVTLPSTMTEPLTNPNDTKPSTVSGDIPAEAVPAGGAATAASASGTGYPPGSSTASTTAAGGGPGAAGQGGAGGDVDVDEDMDEDEDEMLKRAMAMSQAESGDVDMAPEDEDDDDDEDAAMARAIAMSLQESKEGEKK